MGKVLIIKNNDIDIRIHQFAEKSYLENKQYLYYPSDGTKNEKAIIEIKDDFEGNGIVLMITYEKAHPQKIKDIFIGSNVNIDSKNRIEYVMKVHLTNEHHKSTIKSIMDKIDLDISADFDVGRYVIMSEMESLYQELHERIIANNKVSLQTIANQEEKTITVYELSSLAQTDGQAVRIYPNDTLGEYRSEFQRDRERVVNCKAFRRLVDKAQIFGSEKGDYFRTRMTHSLEVNQIAKAIAYALRLNLDLTEAIALGHDLGHTPFGHQGERTLDNILCGKTDVGIVATKDMFEKRCFGGFKHNYQSAHVLTELEEKYKEFPGLNVSIQVVEGVLKHTKLDPENIDIKDFISEEYLERIKIDKNAKIQVCSSLEGQVVAIADEIAQRGHDVDDALTSGVMTIDEFMDRLTINKCYELYRKIKREITEIDDSERLIVDKKDLKIARVVSTIVKYFIETTIIHSVEKIQDYSYLNKITLENNLRLIEFSSEVEKVNLYLEKVVSKRVICNNEVARADHNADMIVKTLFERYYKNPRLLHSGTMHKIFIETIRHENKEVANSAINLNDSSIELVNAEIKKITTDKLDDKLLAGDIEGLDASGRIEQIIIFEKRRILVRAIVDYIAGMTDGYALEEFEKLK